ncbi:hypothetical protein R1sor_010647 [Riccia sorocarpa]|uniref:Uncharacterized protein n=1 Tax=Riccia sorocarpa TaxID=122646 RepID=A0ABD3I026_9MARC
MSWRAENIGEHSVLVLKLRTNLCLQNDQTTIANKIIEEQHDMIEKLTKTKIELEEAIKPKDDHIMELESELEWIDQHEVEEKESSIGNFRDALGHIYDVMKKKYLTKKTKKSTIFKLADQTKSDYEMILRKDRDVFEGFKSHLLSKTDAPLYPEGRIRGMDRA